MAKRAYDRDYIAPTKRLGPSKRALDRRDAKKTQASTPPPDGLPPGVEGRIEHLRAHALSYFTANGHRDPTGTFLWDMADVLARGPAKPVAGRHRTT